MARWPAAQLDTNLVGSDLSYWNCLNGMLRLVLVFAPFSGAVLAAVAWPPL